VKSTPEDHYFHLVGDIMAAMFFRIVLATLLLTTSGAGANVCVNKQLKIRHVCGEIIDAKGQPIPSAKVTILRGELPLREERSDSDGTFTFPQLGAGQYGIRIESPGFPAGNYTIIVESPAASCKRSLRIQMNVGLPDCPGEITFAKARPLRH